MAAPLTEAALARLQLCTEAANTSSYQRDRSARMKKGKEKAQEADPVKTRYREALRWESAANLPSANRHPGWVASRTAAPAHRCGVGSAIDPGQRGRGRMSVNRKVCI